MPKLTLEDLEKIREEARKSIFIREQGQFRAKITVHMGTCGIAAGARNIMNAFLREVEKRGTTDILLTTSGCAGLCSREPMATVELAGQAPVKYVDLTEKKAQEIFEKHVLGGQIVTAYALGIGSEKTDL
ncbi:MAG: (2Fe-2S) ferredoxin domain-containing protein [Candidatus Aminicenantales bacterium]